MRISRVVVEPGTATSRTFAFESDLAVISESPSQTERLIVVFRDLYLGIKSECQIFACIDDVEFEITSDMVSLIGQRLAGRFSVVDLALPPPIKNDPTDIRDVQSVVARAALETVGAIPPTLDVERLDQAALAVDQRLDPLAENAHAAHLRRTGLLQLFSRRSGRDLLDRGDPTVQQLLSFNRVLAARRGQVSSNSAPSTEELANATESLRALVSARIGGLPPEMAAQMTTAAMEQDMAHWVLQQHDRQMSPIVAEKCARHAEGIEVLGPVPLVIDLSRVEGLPPGSDSLRWASRQHGADLQFIVIVGNDNKRSGVEGLFASSPQPA